MSAIMLSSSSQYEDLLCAKWLQELDVYEKYIRTLFINWYIHSNIDLSLVKCLGKI